MSDLEQLKITLRGLSDKDLSEIISHGAMQYSDEIAQTVSFAFWICYMAEQDLKEVLERAWKMSKSAFPEIDHEKADQQIERDCKIKLGKIDPSRENYNSRDITFGDLILIKERLFGKTDLVKLLWKLKKIRDGLSHGRINELKYKEKNLLLRLTKENLIIDYFTLAKKDDSSISPIWNKLSEEDKKDIEEKFNQIMKN
jgi:hypothetical protein